MNFAFRITSAYDVIQESLKEMIDSLECSKVAIYQHDADDEVKRTHIHGLLMGCNRGEDTIRNKFFKGKYDASDYELKQKYKVKEGLEKIKRSYPVDDKYIIYMSKGVYESVFFKGYIQEELDMYKSLWKNHNEKKQEVEKEKSAKPKNIYEECQEIVNQKLPKRTAHVMSAVMVWDYDDQEIVDAIILWANEHHKAINQYKVRDYYDCILMRQKPMKYREGVLHLIQKRNSQ